MNQWTSIDWVVMWKIYRYWFFLLYVVISLPCKFWLFRKVIRATTVKVGLWSSVSSFACPALNVWLPLLPIFGTMLGTLLVGVVTRRDDFAESMRFGVPTVAILMGVEAALFDAALVRIAFRSEREPHRWRYILATNVGVALVAVGGALWWIVRHPPIIIA